MGQTIEERIGAVRILLSSMLDYLPTPVTSSGLIARSAPSGPAPGKRVPCRYCSRRGQVRAERPLSYRICPLCEGTGWRPRRGPRDKPTHPLYEEPWDEYVNAPVGEQVVQNPSSMASHLIDASLERLDHDRSLREGDDSSERFGWERERQVYERRGSYRELHRTLDLQKIQWPPGHRQILRCYFWGISFQLSFDDQLYLNLAEEWLARVMRGPVRVPPWLAEGQAQVRQRSVSELAAEGMSAGQIARALRIPKQKVRRMLNVSGSDGSVLLTVQTVPGEPERVRV